MLIYTGAVAVLFVVVLLLVDSRESGLGSLLVARSGFVGVILSLSLGFAFVPLAICLFMLQAHACMVDGDAHPTPEVTPAHLSGVTFGESNPSLAASGLALLTVTKFI